MRCLTLSLIALAALVAGLPALAAAESPARAKIIKVLPTYIDLKGRHALSPSLYERDAYQALLRKEKQRVSGMRFDIQWKASSTTADKLALRLELRVSNASGSKLVALEQEVSPKKNGSRWSRIVLDGEKYRQASDVIAWRVTILEGDQKVAERTSFLW